ncbi:unnamed protein product [Blumeria hordei]|uniref:Uncharacterized protein n=1 Tax=Blumeria hordei TaxID=2867405 RepID=A0A383UZ77_BLUHO|nr:unnamed protein product [Blumeria hordei]
MSYPASCTNLVKINSFVIACGRLAWKLAVHICHLGRSRNPGDPSSCPPQDPDSNKSLLKYVICSAARDCDEFKLSRCLFITRRCNNGSV